MFKKSKVYTSCFEILLNHVSVLISKLFWISLKWFSKYACYISKHLWYLSICFETYMICFETSDSVSRTFKTKMFLLYTFYPKSFSKVFFNLQSLRIQIQIWKWRSMFNHSGHKTLSPTHAISKCKSSYKGLMFRNMWCKFWNHSVKLCCFKTNKLCFETFFLILSLIVIKQSIFYK